MVVAPGLSRIKAKRDLVINGDFIPAGTEYICGDATLASICGANSDNNPNYELIENGHAEFVKTQIDGTPKEPRSKKVAK